MTLKATSDNLWKLQSFVSSENRDLIMYNYVWLEQLNVCAKYGIPSDKSICFIE